MKGPSPARGDIWMVDFDPTQGHEQSGTRPAVVVSVDAFNHGPAGLVIVVPLTSRHKGIPLHVPIDPPEGGLRVKRFAKCEDVRSISHGRCSRRMGVVTLATMGEVEARLRRLLGL